MRCSTGGFISAGGSSDSCSRQRSRGCRRILRSSKRRRRAGWERMGARSRANAGGEAGADQPVPRAVSGRYSERERDGGGGGGGCSEPNLFGPCGRPCRPVVPQELPAAHFNCGLSGAGPALVAAVAPCSKPGPAAQPRGRLTQIGCKQRRSSPRRRPSLSPAAAASRLSTAG